MIYLILIFLLLVIGLPIAAAVEDERRRKNG